MVKRLLALPITGQILRFGLSTGFSAAMSFGVPVLLHEYADMPQRLAVAIGFFAAYVGNIVLLRLFVFRSKGSWRAQVLRYIPTNGVFRLCEYFAFLGLFEKLGLDYRVALLLVLGTSSVIKFFAYRLIFTDRAGPQFAAPDLEPANPLQR